MNKLGESLFYEVTCDIVDEISDKRIERLERIFPDIEDILDIRENIYYEIIETNIYKSFRRKRENE